MSKALAQMLGKSEESLSAVVAKLEAVSGYHGEDNRLLSDIRATLKPKIAGLGLDPDDTTHPELYHALRSRLEQDNVLMHRLLGAGQGSHNKKIVELIKLVDYPDDVWALKRSVAKNFLRQLPPKRTLRHLGYRSVESLLKRENIDEIYAAAMKIESTGWRKNFVRAHASLQPADFEIRSLELVAMSELKWKKLAKNSQLSVVAQMGMVALWPKPTDHPLSLFIRSLKAVEEIRISSLTLIARQTKPDFGKYLAKLMTGEIEPPAKILDFGISWRTLLHCFGHLPNYASPLLEEPHLQAINSRQISASKALSDLHPCFRWWQGNDFLGATAKGWPLSLNVSDISNDHRLGSTYRQRNHSGLATALWDELIARYIRHPAIEAQIVNQINEGYSPDSSQQIQTPNTFNLARELTAA